MEPRIASRSNARQIKTTSVVDTVVGSFRQKHIFMVGVVLESNLSLANVFADCESPTLLFDSSIDG